MSDSKLDSMDFEYNNRILIVDDNPAIHRDFTKILPSMTEEMESFDDLERGLFGDTLDAAEAEPAGESHTYELHHAYQGQEALKLVEEAESQGNPFAVIFMDVRMPPGWDGIESIKRIWDKYPHHEMVICTAYSDYSWDTILQKVGTTDQLMFLRKPFDVISIKQMALALTKKWSLARKVRQYVQDLEAEVAARTKDLNEKVIELQRAMDEIKVLKGIVPMCMYCNKVRDDENFWQKVDDYIQNNTDTNISHSVCPNCYELAMSTMLKEIKEEEGEE